MWGLNVKNNNVCLIDTSIALDMQSFIEGLVDWTCIELPTNQLLEFSVVASSNKKQYIFIMNWKNEEEGLFLLKQIKRNWPSLLIILMNTQEYPPRRAMRVGAYAVLSSDDTLDDLEEICLSIL